MEATCTAEGTPAPTVRFDDDGSTLDDVTSEAYDVVVTHPNEWTTKAVLRIHDAEVADGMLYITCEARNVVPGMDHHPFSDTHGLIVGNYTLLPAGVRYYLNFVEDDSSAL